MPPTVPPDHDAVARVREALLRNDFTYDAITALLGPVASAALARGDLVPARRATTGGSPLETLVRLFLLGLPASPDAAAAALPVEDAVALGLLDGDRAALDLRPYAADDAHWWVVSDLGSDVRPGPLRPDHVLGIGGASTTLAQATIRTPVSSALDIGTGCGVQALHLSRHATAVTATDTNPRALRLAALTAALNELEWDLREGDLLAPVAGERYDLVVANPPFVVGPGRAAYAYRDSGLAGDAVSERLVREVAGVLTEGGTATLLANWLHPVKGDWQERVGGWLPEGCDALVLQREVQDPAEYVALWLRDAAEPAERADEWLDWFAATGVEAVGFGIVTLRRTGRTQHAVEDARQPVVQPIAPDLSRWLEADVPDRPRVSPDVTLEQSAVVGADGWEVATQALQRHTGLAWRAEVDPVTVALVGACDGTRTVAEIAALLEVAYGVEPAAVTAAVGALSERGFLSPRDAPGR